MTPNREYGDFDALLTAAVHAPSGDNTQPWRLVVDRPRGRIALRLDATRDPSPMNTGQRMARVGIGAALENLLQAAEGCGWSAELEPIAATDLAAVRLTRQGAEGVVPSAIAARVTNRRVYDGSPVPAEVLHQLVRATPGFEGVNTHWIVDRKTLGAAAELIGAADGLMFGEDSMRRAFLSQVRFDAPADAAVEEGLSLGALELTGTDRLALRLMRRLPDWTVKLAGVGRVFAAKARQLVESASGLCLIAAPDRSDATDLNVGRAMQRAWLTLTDRGLAAQPMMSLLVLENALESDDPALVAALGPERVTDLARRFRALFPEIGDQRPAFLLRFGYAPDAGGRTGRRPLADVVACAPPYGGTL